MYCEGLLYFKIDNENCVFAYRGKRNCTESHLAFALVVANSIIIIITYAFAACWADAKLLCLLNGWNHIRAIALQIWMFYTWCKWIQL